MTHDYEVAISMGMGVYIKLIHVCNQHPASKKISEQIQQLISFNTASIQALIPAPTFKLETNMCNWSANLFWWKMYIKQHCLMPKNVKNEIKNQKMPVQSISVFVLSRSCEFPLVIDGDLPFGHKKHDQ